MNELMTTKQVAELIQHPVETLRYWRWKGEGPTSFKLGRSTRYERRDVEAWLAAQKAATRVGGAPAA